MTKLVKALAANVVGGREGRGVDVERLEVGEFRLAHARRNAVEGFGVQVGGVSSLRVGKAYGTSLLVKGAADTGERRYTQIDE